jgi:putative ABC transport system permease protein
LLMQLRQKMSEMPDWKQEIAKRLADLNLNPAREAEIVEELSQHLEDRFQEALAVGASEDEAREMALRELSDENLLGKELRRVEREVAPLSTPLGGGPRKNFLAGILQDLRYGLRQLRRNPGFAAVAVITLALGIGANTAIFSVVYGVLLRPLPYPRPNQIVSISEVASDGHLMHFADPNFDDIRRANHTLAGMAEYDAGGTEIETVVGPAGATQIGVSSISQDFFRVMGVWPIIGRELAAADQRQGAALVALASYGYWQQALNGSPKFSSFKFTVAGHAFSVVGVMPPGFSFPAGAELWFPRGASENPSRTGHNADVVARLRDGVSLAQARSDLSSIARRLFRQYKPDIDMTDSSVLKLQTSLTASVRPALLILLGAVGFLLLVGCANVANLLLARAASRERELAIRAALGASRARLLRQFLAESLLLALFGGGLGVLVAIWGVDGLLAAAPPNLPRIENVSVNLPVLAFALGISVVVAVGLGVATALQATSADPQTALAEGSRGAGGSIASHRLGHSLIGGQVAITLVLLTGAGLLGRSLLRVLSVDPGFRTQNIVTMEMEVPGNEPTDIASAVRAVSDPRPGAFMSALLERLREVPGVRNVGGVSALPLEGGIPDGKFLLLDRRPDFDLTNPKDLARLDQFWVTAPGSEADYGIASGGYFESLGIPLLRGRLFNDHDTASSPQVALISESLAKAVWPRQDPIGRTIEFGNMDGDLRLLTIVGVVGDVRDLTLEKPPEPTVYVNYRQRLRAGRDFSVVIRSAASPASVLAAARRIVRDLDPNVAPRFGTFQEVFAASVESRKFNVTLVGVFALTALLLAVVGLYGVTTFWVTRRTQEFGIRIALGAQKKNVLEMVLGEGLRVALIGVAIGIVGAFGLTRFLSSLLYSVTPTDPLTFATISLILITVALLACYIPARRATKVDPMAALRYE